MKASLALAGLSLTALSLTACGGNDTKTATAPVSTIAATSSSAPTTSAVSSSRGSSAPTSRTTTTTTTTTTIQPAPATTAPAHAATTTKTAPSGGQTIPPPSDDPADGYYSAGSQRRCASDIEVEAAGGASCPFAVAVADKWRANRIDGGGVIYVKSPMTGDTYGVLCKTGAHGSICGTSKGAYIWAPI